MWCGWGKINNDDDDGWHGGKAIRGGNDKEGEWRGDNDEDINN